jgi:sugar lactone lactonase YvrE
VSSPDGNLYLALTTSNSLWIHRFNPNGELTRRYRMESDEVGLLAIFDIDFNEDRIFVVTEESEIRVYHF